MPQKKKPKPKPTSNRGAAAGKDSSARSPRPFLPGLRPQPLPPVRFPPGIIVPTHRVLTPGSTRGSPTGPLQAARGCPGSLWSAGARGADSQGTRRVLPGDPREGGPASRAAGSSCSQEGRGAGVEGRRRPRSRLLAASGARGVAMTTPVSRPILPAPLPREGLGWAGLGGVPGRPSFQKRPYPRLGGRDPPPGRERRPGGDISGPTIPPAGPRTAPMK